jgi:hypothetical protein
MPESFDILKYQFPPPGSELLKGLACEFSDAQPINGRQNIMAEINIGEGQAFVLSEVEAGITFVDDPPRTTTTKYGPFVKSSAVFLFYNLQESDIIRGTSPPVVSPAAPESEKSKFVTLLKPLPVCFETKAAGQDRVGPGAWAGPLVFGGPRKLAVAFYAYDSISAALPNCDVSGRVSGWFFSDPDKTWKDSFR